MKHSSWINLLLPDSYGKEVNNSIHFTSPPVRFICCLLYGPELIASTQLKSKTESFFSLTQPAKCYCFLRHASVLPIVAQKVAERQKRQVATVYAYFYAAAVLQ